MSGVKLYVASTYFEEPLSEGNMIISNGTSFVKLEDYQKLQQVCDAALAQVELLRDSASEICDDYFDCLERYDIDSEDMNSTHKAHYDRMTALNWAVASTPAQCLAERDAEVAAKAIEDAIDAAPSRLKYSLPLVDVCELYEYANQLRKGSL
jgi:hypothetical protein